MPRFEVAFHTSQDQERRENKSLLICKSLKFEGKPQKYGVVFTIAVEVTSLNKRNFELWQ